ncbi:MAG: HDOD domain-containing protein [Candidatus Cloacimonetes bacterium]|nr:HDOD domain-containing protein [Candidatus Cloacimonadota bacterium]
MESNLKLGCVVLEKSIEKKVQVIIEKMKYGIKVYTYKNFDVLINSIVKEEIDYIFVDIASNRQDLLSFLNKVQEEFPHVVRVLITDTLSNDLVLMANDLIHLIIEKKTLDQNLKNIFLRAARLRNMLKNPDLIKLTNSFNNLVVLKPQHLQLLQYLSRDDYTNKEICEIIEKNVALSAKVLQVANMTAFAPTQIVQSVSVAVFFLGANILRALVLNMQVFSIDSGKGNLYRYISILERHCQNIASCSKTIAIAFNADRNLQNDSYTAGLLHDIGKLVIMDKTPNWEKIQKLSDENDLIIWKAEEAFLGTTHAQIGAYFLGIWNFPDSIIDAVAYHHNPCSCDNISISPLTFVHIAEAMIKENKTVSLEEFQKQLDIDYLDKLGLTEKAINYYKSYLGLTIEVIEEEVEE